MGFKPWEQLLFSAGATSGRTQVLQSAVLLISILRPLASPLARGPCELELHAAGVWGKPEQGHFRRFSSGLGFAPDHDRHTSSFLVPFTIL
jgi:hypothetical protein